jgi:hypothetical protein
LIPATAPRNRSAFLLVLASQFLSSLADNALLIAAIGMLLERRAPGWTAPGLRLLFYLPYVLLAAFAGAVADSFPKGRVLLATNLVKLGGCLLLLAQVHPLVAYGLIGFGAAAYSPAKYGILPEILAPGELVAANAWIEASTVLSILLGVGLGSVLLDPAIALPRMVASVARNASIFIGAVYLMAAGCAAAIPRSIPRSIPSTIPRAIAAASPTSIPAASPAAMAGALPAGAPPSTAAARVRSLPTEFVASLMLLWRDRDCRVSLAVTSLFWAVSASLQFIILRWAAQALQLPLARAALLQIAVALGMIAGAAAAARWIPLRLARATLPLGIAIGAILFMLAFVSGIRIAIALLVLIGVLSGLLLVPMNALLQHRGQALMQPGRSIAVQNFNESLASLIALAIYGGLLYADVPLGAIIAGLGVVVVLAIVVTGLSRR